jgi:hypothetical protein
MNVEQVNKMGGPELQETFGWTARVVLQTARVNSKDWRNDPTYTNSAAQYCAVYNASIQHRAASVQS